MFWVLNYIQEVDRVRSFSRAAQNLHLSQPSLSLTVKKFEQSVGIQIFDRSVTPIRLTEAGDVYLRGIRQILSIQSELEAYVDDYNQLKTGKLTLGAAHFVASHLLPPLIAQFSRRYPKVDIQLVEGDFVGLHEMVLSGKVDLFLDSNGFEETLFEAIPLFEEHILLAVPSADRANTRLADFQLQPRDVCCGRHLCPGFPAVDLRAFRKHRFLMLEKGHDLRSRAKQMCRNHGFEPVAAMELNQLMTVYNMVGQGLGVAFVSDTLVKLSTHTERVVFYKLEGPQAARNIHMAYKRNRYVSKAMGAFIEHMEETRGGELPGARDEE